MSNSPGRLFIVATPIGNLGDISGRAVEVLQSVDLILAEDTRHSAGLLSHLGIRTKVSAFHEHNEARMKDAVIAKLGTGLDAAIISDAGTPLISDPGFQLVRSAHQRGIQVIPIPGPSAVLAALSASGLPTDRFLFEGFLPSRREARRQRLRAIARRRETLVILESPHRVLAALEDMVEILGDARMATIAKELTKIFETIRTDTLSALHAWLGEREERQRGEFVIVVAAAEGAEADPEAEAHRELLRALMGELPLKTAVRLAARISGSSRNRLYALALELSSDGERGA
ncbi:MAG TPA: 16S rRNA (cytidine(1402)-2'-O)-methyltransferase [Gammaproteobacteria bacterium]|nr:16S rRNA (cytidine(1402)-2'-O)-methyltransferase [Gammaproteobacteria bacterium]